MVPPWSFSPDRSRLAVARHEGGVVEALRLVDVRRMRPAGEIRVGSIGAVGLVAWPAPERLLAVQEVCCDERQQLLVADVARRRVTARRALGGTVQAVGRTGRELVLLIAPPKRIGPARLAVVAGAGNVRFVALDRVRAGAQPLEDVDFGLRERRPGLAVDPQGRRAFVVDEDLVAAVDLARGAVSYHALTERRSLAARLRDFLDPAAYAKGVTGPTRSARWLGDGWLAVTGADERLTEPRLRPAGLRMVDTRDWTYRVIDEGASDVRIAGRLLLATGAQLDGEDTIGLVAYGLDGDRRFGLFADGQPWCTRSWMAAPSSTPACGPTAASRRCASSTSPAAGSPASGPDRCPSCCSSPPGAGGTADGNHCAASPSPPRCSSRSRPRRPRCERVRFCERWRAAGRDDRCRATGERTARRRRVLRRYGGGRRRPDGSGALLVVEAARRRHRRRATFRSSRSSQRRCSSSAPPCWSAGASSRPDVRGVSLPADATASRTP